VKFGVELAHALGVSAKVVSSVARQRAHVDPSLSALAFDPHNDVVDEAEDERAVFRFDVTRCAPALGWLLGNDPPMQTARGLADRVEHFLGGAIDHHRLKLREDLGLMGRITGTGIGHGVGAPGAVARQHGKLGRVLGIGGDVVEVRRPEVEGDDARRPCKNRKAHHDAGSGAPCPRGAAPPDDDCRADPQQQRQDGAGERGCDEAGGERRIHATETVQNQREQDDRRAE